MNSRKKKNNPNFINPNAPNLEVIQSKCKQNHIKDTDLLSSYSSLLEASLSAFLFLVSPLVYYPKNKQSKLIMYKIKNKNLPNINTGELEFYFLDRIRTVFSYERDCSSSTFFLRPSEGFASKP